MNSRWIFLTTTAALFFLWIIVPASSAPSPYGRMNFLRSPKEKGCYYLLKHYKNGEEIETNEPCLNCSCVNSMLMCYLRVCPYVRPLGDKCIIEKIAGECCPRITCPDVEPEPEATTPEPFVGEGCYIEGQHYQEGALIPSDPEKPCEVCYCIRNSSACVMQECTLGVSGCSPVFSPNSCCPTRYNCSAEAATTVPPELRHPSVPELGCRANGRNYVDGEAVPSKDACEHCYCMKHEVVCAVQECKAPCEGCIPIPSDNDQCCPERYECPAPSRTVPAVNVNFSNESMHHEEPSIPMTGQTSPMTANESGHSIVDTETRIADPKKTADVEVVAQTSTMTPTTLFHSTTEGIAQTSSTTEIPYAIEVQTEPEEPKEKPRNESREEPREKIPSGDHHASQPDSSTSVKSEDVHPSLATEEEKPVSDERHTESPSSSSESPLTEDMETDSPIRMSTENMIVMPGQPRRDEGDMALKRPGVNRKTFPSVGVIPGEGTCRHEGKRYKNGDEVKVNNPCVEYCYCMNSVIYCDEAACQEIKPIEGQNCTKVKSTTECCPRYECQPFPTTTTPEPTTVSIHPSSTEEFKVSEHELTSSPPTTMSETPSTELASSVVTESTFSTTTEGTGSSTEELSSKIPFIEPVEKELMLPEVVKEIKLPEAEETTTILSVIKGFFSTTTTEQPEEVTTLSSVSESTHDSLPVTEVIQETHDETTTSPVLHEESSTEASVEITTQSIVEDKNHKIPSFSQLPSVSTEIPTETSTEGTSTSTQTVIVESIDREIELPAVPTTVIPIKEESVTTLKPQSYPPHDEVYEVEEPKTETPVSSTPSPSSTSQEVSPTEVTSSSTSTYAPELPQEVTTSAPHIAEGHEPAIETSEVTTTPSSTSTEVEDKEIPAVHVEYEEEVKGEQTTVSTVIQESKSEGTSTSSTSTSSPPPESPEDEVKVDEITTRQPVVDQTSQSPVASINEIDREAAPTTTESSLESSSVWTETSSSSTTIIQTSSESTLTSSASPSSLEEVEAITTESTVIREIPQGSEEADQQKGKKKEEESRAGEVDVTTPSPSQETPAVKDKEGEDDVRREDEAATSSKPQKDDELIESESDQTTPSPSLTPDSSPALEQQEVSTLSPSPSFSTPSSSVPVSQEPLTSTVQQEIKTTTRIISPTTTVTPETDSPIQADEESKGLEEVTTISTQKQVQDNGDEGKKIDITEEAETTTARLPQEELVRESQPTSATVVSSTEAITSKVISTMELETTTILSVIKGFFSTTTEQPDEATTQSSVSESSTEILPVTEVSKTHEIHSEATTSPVLHEESSTEASVEITTQSIVEDKNHKIPSFSQLPSVSTETPTEASSEEISTSTQTVIVESIDREIELPAVPTTVIPIKEESVTTLKPQSYPHDEVEEPKTETPVSSTSSPSQDISSTELTSSSTSTHTPEISTDSPMTQEILRTEQELEKKKKAEEIPVEEAVVTTVLPIQDVKDIFKDDIDGVKPVEDSKSSKGEVSPVVGDIEVTTQATKDSSTPSEFSPEKDLSSSTSPSSLISTTTVGLISEESVTTVVPHLITEHVSSTTLPETTSVDVEIKAIDEVTTQAAAEEKREETKIVEPTHETESTTTSISVDQEDLAKPSEEAIEKRLDVGPVTDFPQDVLSSTAETPTTLPTIISEHKELPASFPIKPLEPQVEYEEVKPEITTTAAGIQQTEVSASSTPFSAASIPESNMKENEIKDDVITTEVPVMIETSPPVSISEEASPTSTTESVPSSTTSPSIEVKLDVESSTAQQPLSPESPKAEEFSTALPSSSTTAEPMTEAVVSSESPTTTTTIKSLVGEEGEIPMAFPAREEAPTTKTPEVEEAKEVSEQRDEAKQELPAQGVQDTQTVKSEPTTLPPFVPNVTDFVLKEIVTTTTLSPTTLKSIVSEVANVTTEKSIESSTVVSTTPTTTTTTASSSLTSTESTTTEEDAAKEEPEEEHDDTTCIFEGKAFQSAEQIPRPHPCDFCFCFRGDIICLQQTCPPPIPRCYETPIQGFCCPRYECPVQSTSSNSTTPRSVGETKGCNVDGEFYQIGERIKPASGPCLECKCDHSGLVQCNPQNCSPQAPLLLRMNREFFTAATRRR